MSFPLHRPRRLRRSAAMRRLVAETRLHPAELILPAFIKEGAAEPVPIASMPGVVQHTADSLKAAGAEAAGDVDEVVHEIAVPLAEPEQDGVGGLVRVFVEKLGANRILDGLGEGGIRVLVPADLLHNIARAYPQPRCVSVHSCGTQVPCPPLQFRWLVWALA